MRKWHFIFLLLLALSSCSESSIDPTPLPRSQVSVQPSLAKTLTPTSQTLIPTFHPFPTPTLAVSQSVSVTTLPFRSTVLGEIRQLHIFLPGDYDVRQNTYYRVIYANDGQQMDGTTMSKVLEDIYRSGKVIPFILVGIPTIDGDTRTDELGTGNLPNISGQGKKSESYNKFVIEEVIPYINKNYRVLPGPRNTAIMGWSLGGLNAFYLGWMYPDQFGVIGAFSPSFWLRSPNKVNNEARIVHQLVNGMEHRPGMRFWFEAGTAEPFYDVDKDGKHDVIQDIRELMNALSKKNYFPEQDMKLIIDEGGTHDQDTWLKHLPEFLEWSFPAKK